MDGENQNKSMILKFFEFLIEDKIETSLDTHPRKHHPLTTKSASNVQVAVTKLNDKSINIKKPIKKHVSEIVLRRAPSMGDKLRSYVRKLMPPTGNICNKCNLPKATSKPSVYNRNEKHVRHGCQVADEISEVKRTQEDMRGRGEMKSKATSGRNDDAHKSDVTLVYPAFFYFVNEVDVMKRNGKCNIDFESVDEMAKCITKVWNGMNDAQKKPYYDKMRDAGSKEENEWIQSEIEKRLSNELASEYKQRDKRVKANK